MRATSALACIPVTLLLAGCSGGVKLTSVPAGCTTTTSIAVTYTVGVESSITPVPECIDVVAGSTVTLTFTPTPGLEDARTRFKWLLGNGWLRGTNDMTADRIV